MKSLLRFSIFIVYAHQALTSCGNGHNAYNSTSDVHNYKIFYKKLMDINKRGKYSYYAQVIPLYDNDSSLIKITIIDMNLDSIPSTLEEFRKLKSLTVNNCGIESMNSIRNRYVEQINLDNNKINHLPMISSILPKAKSLSMKRNLLAGEVDLAKLGSTVTTVNISTNHITKLLYTSGITNIRTINITGNPIAQIHFSVYGIKSLKYIIVSPLDIKEFRHAYMSKLFIYDTLKKD